MGAGLILSKQEVPYWSPSSSGKFPIFFCFFGTFSYISYVNCLNRTHPLINTWITLVTSNWDQWVILYNRFFVFVSINVNLHCTITGARPSSTRRKRQSQFLSKPSRARRWRIQTWWWLSSRQIRLSWWGSKVPTKVHNKSITAIITILLSSWPSSSSLFTILWIVTIITIQQWSWSQWSSWSPPSSCSWSS